MIATINVRELFATPLVVARMPEGDIAALNTELEALILEKEAAMKSVSVSNAGGWQSEATIMDWGGPAVKKITDAMIELLNQITLYLDTGTKTYSRVGIQWRVHGWANINRKGNHNLVHTHPGAYWSAVYYVKVPQVEAAQPQPGGHLELFDPRGTLPIMYCPVLRFGIKGMTSAGTSELHAPRAGDMVIFPSWLPHGVTPYHGDETRISIALNFSV